MRVNNVFSGRPTYYDRNPSAKAQVSHQFSTAPHSSTTRWTYTVPGGRKAYVESISVETIRSVVATTPSDFFADVNGTFGGVTIYLMRIDTWTNAVGDGKAVYGSSGGLMLAGDSLSGEDSDASTGGLVSFIADAKVSEFDA